MKKHFFLFFLSCLSSLASPASPAAGYERIITLGAPAAELVYALGLGEAVLARGDLDLWPPALRALPGVGGASNPNMELILQLRPDLLVADRNFSLLAARLESYGIPTLLFGAYNTHEVIPAVSLLADKLDRKERGVALAADLQAMLDLAQSRLKGIDPAARPRGLALTGKAGEYFSFSGRDGWRFLDLAGAVNICAGLTQPFPIVSPEWLAAAGPDFVLLSPYRMDYAEEEREAALERALLEFKPVRDAAGLKRTRLIALDDLLTFGPRSVPGVLYLAKALHPALFADVRAEDIHLEFLRKYFDYAPQGGHIYAME